MDNTVPSEITERLAKVLKNCPAGWTGSNIRLERGAWVVDLRDEERRPAGTIVLLLPPRA